MSVCARHCASLFSMCMVRALVKKWLLKITSCISYVASFVRIYWIVQFISPFPKESLSLLPKTAKQNKTNANLHAKFRWIFVCNLHHYFGAYASYFHSNQCAPSSVPYLLNADMLRAHLSARIMGILIPIFSSFGWKLPWNGQCFCYKSTNFCMASDRTINRHQNDFRRFWRGKIEIITFRGKCINCSQRPLKRHQFYFLYLAQWHTFTQMYRRHSPIYTVHVHPRNCIKGKEACYSKLLFGFRHLNGIQVKTIEWIWISIDFIETSIRRSAFLFFFFTRMVFIELFRTLMGINMMAVALNQHLIHSI